MSDTVDREDSASFDLRHREDDGEGLGLLEIGIVLKARWKRLVLWPVVAGAISYGIAWLIPPTYTAHTSFLPPQQQQSSAAAALSSLGALAGIAGNVGGIKSPADQYVALMQSATVSNRLIDKFKLMDVYDVRYRVDARKNLLKNASITVGKKDGLLSVDVDDRNAVRAADIANAYVDELRHLTSTLAVTEAQQRRTFFEKQLQQTKDRLTIAQRALEASGFTQGALRSEPKAAAEGYAKLQAEVTANEVRLQTMRGYLKESAPEFQQTQDTLAALRSQLAKAEQASQRTSSGENDYVGRYREFKYQETLFDLFARQYELAKVDESREGALIQVVDVAQPPERRSKPKRLMIAFGAALAAGLVAALWSLLRVFWQTNAASDSQRAARLEALRTALQQP